MHKETYRDGSSHVEVFYAEDREARKELARLAADAWQRPETIRVEQGLLSPGRNDPCPCGSGKKFKKCCLQGSRLKGE